MISQKSPPKWTLVLVSRSVCLWGCRLFYSRCRPYDAALISLSIVNQLEDVPSSKCDRCACARFRGEWRAAATHPENIRSLLPVKVIYSHRSEHRVAPHQTRPAPWRSSHKSVNVLSPCSTSNSFATRCRRYCHLWILHNGNLSISRSRWSRGLRRRTEGTRLMG